jgi:hypothetical protein
MPYNRNRILFLVCMPLAGIGMGCSLDKMIADAFPRPEHTYLVLLRDQRYYIVPLLYMMILHEIESEEVKAEIREHLEIPNPFDKQWSEVSRPIALLEDEVRAIRDHEHDCIKPTERGTNLFSVVPLGERNEADIAYLKDIVMRSESAGCAVGFGVTTSLSLGSCDTMAFLEDWSSK